MTTTLRLGTFTSPVLLEVARVTGALEHAGLDVVEQAVPSSPAQFRSLRDGELDAVLTNPDNGLAYRFVPDNPLGELLDVVMVAAIDRGLGLTLCSAPGSAAPASGSRLGVDAATSGFALLAYALLDRLGIDYRELRLETLGSTPARAVALVTGGCDVTMLNAGNELRARDDGCSAIGSVDEIGPYLGTVLVRRGDTPAEPIALLARTLLEVSQRIVAGQLDREASAATERVLGLPTHLAREHVAVLRDAHHGLVPSGIIDAASIETALELRERFLPSPFLDEARRGWRGMLATA